jgi:hypothetical protein
MDVHYSQHEYVLLGVSVSDANILQQMTAMTRRSPPQEHGQDPSSLPY